MMNWTQTHANLLIAVGGNSVDVANVHHGHTLPGVQARQEADDLTDAGALTRDGIVYRVDDWQTAGEVVESVYGPLSGPGQRRTGLRGLTDADEFLVDVWAHLHPDYLDPDLVGLQEIADRLDVAEQTVRQWRAPSRDVGLPEPDWVLSGRPIWRWSTVEAWARETGRL